MKIYGTYQRLAFGGLILSAFLILAYNYFQVSSLEGRPLKGYSPTIKQMEADFSRLERLISEKAALLAQTGNATDFYARYQRRIGKAVFQKTENTARPNENAVSASPQPALPELKGIIQINDAGGRIRYKAVIGDGIYRENDQVEQFTIRRISDNGVDLQRGRKHWHLEKPATRYSNDLGH
jgi:hypothetical protein